MSLVNKFDDVEWLKTKVKKHCGLTFDGQRHVYFLQKLEERVKSLELKSITEYHCYLMTEDKEGTEWKNLINDITINETYFFRERQQFEVLKRTVLPEIVKTRYPIQNIRILSAACANGAEPYSLAILLSQKNVEEKWHIEIDAGDINEKNLDNARNGIYTEFDLRNIDPLIKATFFEHHNSRYMLAPSIRERVHFFQMNLLNLIRLKNREPYQVIFCRNVFYYFEIPTREQIIKGLSECLSVDGYLFAGQTEFIGELSIPFQTCRDGDVVFYKKISKR